MQNYNKLFTAGRFAKLHNINKRTLHYYDDIGLFSPSVKGENGYRYYTYLQSAELEMLLALRELNMSICEIEAYMKNRSPAAFHSIIKEKTYEIDKSIERLKEIRNLLQNKENALNICESTNLDDIDTFNAKDEYLLLSRCITGSYDEDDYAVLLEHTQNLNTYRMFNKSYGSMISAEKILAGNFESYDCFFTKTTKQAAERALFLKPRGKYIKAYCKGSWDNLPHTYMRIAEYAKAHKLKLTGFAFEEGLNELAISSMDEYVTMITIRFEG